MIFLPSLPLHLRYPDIVQQQQVAWEIRIRQLCTQLKLEHLVSDGVRRKRNPGQHSGESGSDSDSGFKSLVSGVHISTPSKNTNRKRLRQSSVCHTTDTDKDANNSLKPPDRKRVRTQSLSSSHSSGLSSPHSTTTKLPCLQTDVVSSKFCIPTSPPPVKINSPKLKLKRSPSSHDISQSAIMDNGHNDTNSNTELSSQTDLISNHIGLPCTPLQSVNDTNIDNNDSVLKFDSDNEMPELLMNNSINFVKNVLNTQPIVALSALTKVYQNSPPPPPGSESERELLKTYLLKVLQTIDARQLTVCWPSIPTALEKEPLFVIKVAGPECGAVSESIAQFRDIILALYESLPSFKMKDLQEKCPIFPPKGMSEKAMRTFIKKEFKWIIIIIITSYIAYLLLTGYRPTSFTRSQRCRIIHGMKAAEMTLVKHIQTAEDSVESQSHWLSCPELTDTW
ncbi:unnamed protein product [Schistosoma curassoni]|uniref:Uncharacterized protein n=1 Tax=Schistosoma curassoni TaxID=6186 RepID=A0A3P8D836_9TREM|nr:unnamed protein product [Schistosoma curassoni]